MKKTIKKTLSTILALSLIATQVISNVYTVSATSTEFIVDVQSEAIESMIDAQNCITLSTSDHQEFFDFGGENKEILLGFNQKNFRTLIEDDVKIILFIENVKSIAEKAFLGDSQITIIYLFHGVEHIGEYAFSNNEKLKNVTMTNSVTNVCRGAFADNFALENVVFTRNNTENEYVFTSGVDVCKNIGYEGFDLTFDTICSKDENGKELPQILNSSSSVFSGLKLKNIMIPEGYVYVGGNQFENCEATSIWFPNTLEAFDGRFKMPVNEDLIVNTGNDVVAKSLNSLYFGFGDSNIDGRIDNLDLVNTAQALLKTKEFGWKGKMSADINIDGVVDVADLAMLKQYLMGDTVDNIK